MFYLFLSISDLTDFLEHFTFLLYQVIIVPTSTIIFLRLQKHGKVDINTL